MVNQILSNDFDMIFFNLGVGLCAAASIFRIKIKEIRGKIHVPYIDWQPYLQK